MYTYLRVIYKKMGVRRCPNCHQVIRKPRELDERSETIPCSAYGFEVNNLKKDHFSFNTIEGACRACSELEKRLEIRIDGVVDVEEI